ncbi:hypothetical protein BHM03_00024358 [Ensete ventricosum]|nr:hypothetical protein BHM03_00024358 [Ensete ventricosum]
MRDNHTLLWRLSPYDFRVHALAGYSNPQTMKVGGLLRQQPITVLIDTCITNNFLNSKVAICMTLQIKVIGSESRRCLRGRGGHMHAVCMQRCLATAKPTAGATSHGQVTCKGRPPAGAEARKGRPPAGTVGCGQPCRQQGWPPLGRAAVGRKGQPSPV